jgi:alpha-tubulin suppressor-like RCC1 family protein
MRCPLHLVTLVSVVIACSPDQIPTDPAADAMTAAPAAATVAFRQVSNGTDHTCAVAGDDRAYCWGYNNLGQLGDGTAEQRTRPVAVAGGLRFRLVSAGNGNTCGITSDGLAYCWGNIGQPAPAPVPGGRRWRTIDAGLDFACGLSDPDRQAYCWGVNFMGQLGDGTLSGRAVPTPVLGGRAYRNITTGAAHTCAVTVDNKAFCWGDNRDVQLGDGTTLRRRTRPRLVAGDHAFLQVDAGREHTCGVTTDDRALCWGSTMDGIGDGSTAPRSVPTALATTQRFDRVSGFGEHSCAETTANRAYCWGFNRYGGLGDGTTTRRLRPVAVTGGLTFTQVSAGGTHSCGITGVGALYCWGGNYTGQLGDGTLEDREVPTLIAVP